MIPVKHIDPEDLPLYAMQLLSPEEMEELGLHLQHSVEARRVLSEIYGDLSLFAHTAEMHSPPALTRQRLMKHVAREKKVVPASLQPPVESISAPGSLSLVEERPRRSVAARALPWLGWAIAAGCAVEIANLYTQDRHLLSTNTAQWAEMHQNAAAVGRASLITETLQDPAAVHVALTSTGVKPPPEGRASYVADKGSLLFVASNLEPLQSYKTYELWLIPADGRDPIAAGTFRPDERGNASVVLPQLPKGVAAKAFGVTIEDGEGASQPTTPIILKGTAS